MTAPQHITLTGFSGSGKSTIAGLVAQRLGWQAIDADDYIEEQHGRLVPDIIAQDGAGYCTHLERAACRCTAYAQRPLPCRVFDCRNDKRIWLDFENGVINPNLEDMFQGKVPAEA